MLAGNPVHFDKGFFLGAVRLGVSEKDEMFEVFALVSDEFHGLRDRSNLDLAQAALAHADEFQEVRRRESGELAEFAPRECTVTFTVIVIVLHVGAIIFVFGNRFHAYKIGLLIPEVNI